MILTHVTGSRWRDSVSATSSAHSFSRVTQACRKVTYKERIDVAEENLLNCAYAAKSAYPTPLNYAHLGVGVVAIYRHVTLAVALEIAVLSDYAVYTLFKTFADPPLPRFLLGVPHDGLDSDLDTVTLLPESQFT
jgi:hypothetical protein